MAESRLEWTDALTEKLIELFRTRECFWKVTEPSYSDRNERVKATGEIAAELNISGKR